MEFVYCRFCYEKILRPLRDRAVPTRELCTQASRVPMEPVDHAM